jgi:dolichol-phosphate mannosyltransferase
LYVSTFLGFFIAGVSFLYGFYALYVRFFTNQFVPGWTSILASVLLLGGIQLIAIGVLGQYLAKIYEEVKQRPLYIVKEITKY